MGRRRQERRRRRQQWQGRGLPHRAAAEALQLGSEHRVLGGNHGMGIHHQPSIFFAED